MASADKNKLALEALTRAVVDPTPRVLLGPAKSPGIFIGSSQGAKDAAKLCIEKNWIKPTGEFQGTGTKKKELYQITANGAQHSLENSEPIQLLEESLGLLVRIQKMRDEVENTLHSLQQQERITGILLERLKPPDIHRLVSEISGIEKPQSGRESPCAEWLEEALKSLNDYQNRNPTAYCPLPELFEAITNGRELTIGQFHDGIRRLVQQGKIRLHPFTGAAYQLQKEQYALVAGQEIKYYVERLTNS